MPQYAQRKHLTRSLVHALIKHGRLTTTNSRAILLKRQIDRLVSLAKKGTPSSLRRVRQLIANNKLANRFINEIVPNFADLESGFTRRILVEPRRGDSAKMAQIEWTKSVEDKKEAAGKKKDREKKENKSKSK